MGRKSLEEITMSELAKTASVSRSTLYNHFDNVMDVYNRLFEDFWTRTTPLLEGVSLDDDAECPSRPFCMMLRESSEYRSVIKERTFLDALLTNDDYLQSHDLYRLLTERGYSESQARALSAFQLTGCFTIARLSESDDREWRQIKAAMDTFIQGGIKALLEERLP